MSSDLLEILVLIALAAVVLYRLKSVIGTRTGHEGPPDFARGRQGKPAAGTTVTDLRSAPDTDDEEVERLEETLQNAPPRARDALEAIRRYEPDFDLSGFVEGGRSAYEMILMAYEEGDRDTLQQLLAPDVFQAFRSGIDAREAADLRVEARFIGVREAKVVDVQFDDVSKIADITVRFVGELITAVYDSENRVVEGDPNEIRRQSDSWTFSREMGSVDPNWLLTGTGS